MTDPAQFTAKMSEVDEAMTGVDGGESHLPLSEDETRVLELYDKLQELRLEIAIINAQQAGKVTFTCQARRWKKVTLLTRTFTGFSGTKGDEDLTAAQNALLTARARYRLRNDAIEAVMVANPILKAVHSGTQASPIERHVLSFIIAESTVVLPPADPSAQRSLPIRAAKGRDVHFGGQARREQDKAAP